MKRAPITIPTSFMDIEDCFENQVVENNNHTLEDITDTDRSTVQSRSARSESLVGAETKKQRGILSTPEDKLLTAQAQSEDLIANNKISKAMRELIRCVALSRLVYGDGHWRFAEAIAKLAFGYLLQGLHFQAKQHAESARNIMLTGVHLPESQTEKGKVLEALLTTYYSLGTAYLLQKSVREAHQNLLKAENILDELQSLRGMQHLPIMITEKDVNLSLGRVAILQNKPASAITFFEKAATYVKACKGEDSLELIIIYQEMGKAEQMRARHEEAVEHLLQAYSITVANNTDDSEEAANAALLLAKSYAATKKLKYNEFAEKYFNESINKYQAAFGEENPEAFKPVDEFSNWLIQTGRSQESYDLLNSTLSFRIEAFGDYSESVAETYNVMASIVLTDGDMKKAYKLLSKCLEIQTILFGSQHRKTKQTQEMLDMLQKSPVIIANNRKMNQKISNNLEP
ncbi:tetratricopeptide repeat protein 23-like isoform X1 [Erpetoichthys calabaricus]|uniref:tetratricopeptide repeat protein 23-like isoform X1 n=2 Tax=Erpetoichthys calabaricus TaxID=27687 RepID=UPI0022341C87|nr:tetratricopeptide repeat protein 23-like isoform X1 [Erpetoichthys calabaricus]